jgi:uncharacterized Tic20 family protein
MEDNTQISQNDKNWAMACHLSAFAGSFFPLGSVLGPMICWLSRKDTSDWVDKNGKASLNFQISMLLYFVLSIPLIFMVVGIPIVMFIWILKVVCTIVASVKTARMESFKYPLSIPFFQ